MWEHTSAKSPIRRCIIDQIVARLDPAQFKEFCAEWPADLVLQVAISLMERHVDYETFDRKALDKRMKSYMEAEGDA